MEQPSPFSGRSLEELSKQEKKYKKALQHIDRKISDNINRATGKKHTSRKMQKWEHEKETIEKEISDIKDACRQLLDTLTTKVEDIPFKVMDKELLLPYLRTPEFQKKVRVEYLNFPIRAVHALGSNNMAMLDQVLDFYTQHGKEGFMELPGIYIKSAEDIVDTLKEYGLIENL